MKYIKLLGRVLVDILRVTLYVLIFLLTVFILYMNYFSDAARDRYVHNMYDKIWASTGQSQNYLPLIIVDEPVDNAYNNGSFIVIYTGLINHTKSWDEVAMVLGHEIAHYNLGHLLRQPPFIIKEGMEINDAIAGLEANADKLGAFYMMKAGYDICKGRELFKFWLGEHGNAIGQDHPTNSYRYDELNVGC